MCLTKKIICIFQVLLQLRWPWDIAVANKVEEGIAGQGVLTSSLRGGIFTCQIPFSLCCFPSPCLDGRHWCGPNSHLEDKGQQAWGQSHPLRRQKDRRWISADMLGQPLQPGLPLPLVFIGEKIESNAYLVKSLQVTCCLFPTNYILIHIGWKGKQGRRIRWF